MRAYGAYTITQSGTKAEIGSNRKNKTSNDWFIGRRGPPPPRLSIHTFYTNITKDPKRREGCLRRKPISPTISNPIGQWEQHLRTFLLFRSKYLRNDHHHLSFLHFQINGVTIQKKKIKLKYIFTIHLKMVVSECVILSNYYSQIGETRTAEISA